MAKQDYIPKPDNDFLIWHDQYKTAVLADAGTFGLTGADTNAVTNDNSALHTKITVANNTAAVAKQATADKTATRGTVESNVRALTRRIKAHPAYTVALGQQLGIEGAQDTTDLSTSKPDLSGTDQTGGNVELDFSKSTSDGVNLYGKRDNDADFVFLARDTSSPYVDNRPLLTAGKPELRHYKAVYVSGDAEIGLFSDDVIVNCQP
jgi:hypothetical protein